MSDNKVSRSIRSGGDAQGALPKPRRGGPPPLAWLIIGLLLVIGTIAFLTVDRGRDPVRPGPTMPMDLPEAPRGDRAGPAACDPAPSTGRSGGPAQPASPSN
jgi:hypothetical protein